MRQPLEEWRSYATDVPAGEDRSFQLRWFWKYDVAAGGEFRARLRLSEDEVTSLDLTNPSLELNFTVSGEVADFEMFETTIVLPDGVQSFDLTFISGGALSAIGTIYIDDVSASIITAPVLPGDYNHDGIVDAADYVVWRKTDSGNSQGYTDWQDEFRRGHGRRWRLGGSVAPPDRRARTGNAGAADVCGGWLVSPARPGRIESPSNSSTRDTGQQWTVS